MGHSKIPRQQDVFDLIEQGWIVLPAYRYEKRPCVKWRHFLQERPDKDHLVHLNTVFNTGRWCVLTGQFSGITVIDYDQPLNKDWLPKVAGSWIETPSGGRHYYLQWQEGHQRGIQVKPNIDVPHIVMFYETPIPVWVTDPTLEEIIASIPSHRSELPKTPFKPKHITMQGLSECAFIRWYQERRHDPKWDGRYPLARAYASNVYMAADANDDDLRLGPAYRHQRDIYSKVSFPLTCRYIDNHWPCPHFHEGTGTCLQAAGITTPYGLAGRNS